jgi:asparagine synthase (glutamine-hydrolysing)
MLAARAVWPPGGSSRLWIAEAESRDADTLGGGPFGCLLSRVLRGTINSSTVVAYLRDVGPQSVVLDSSAASALCSLAPPFAAVSCTGPDAPVVAVTDQLGYRQLYWHQGDDWAGVSTSSLALARCAGAGSDVESLAARSLLGFHLGDATPFPGVRKLGPAGICALTGGTVHLGAYSDVAFAIRRDGLSLHERVRTTAELLGEIIGRHVEEDPDLVLQLSGGLDSRVQLAAVPPKLRAGLRTLTVHDRGSRDVGVAEHIATREKLKHRAFSLEGIAELDPESAYALVRRAALRYDCSGDPVAQGVLDWAEGQLGGGTRMHGFGGEIARGFYYAGQRQHERATPALVDRLARWRMFVNDAIETVCLAHSLRAQVRDMALRQLRDIFSAYDCDWLTATDQFYLRERMARWVGTGLSVACVERTLISPLLDPRFVALARGALPADKRGSQFMARVLQELDPQLARIPLESGYVPVEMAARGLTARRRSAAVTSRKVMSKMRQRVIRTARPGAGTPLLAGRILDHWRARPDLLNDIAGNGVIDEAWISQLLVGQRTADAATVAFLANLQIAAEMTR